MKLLCADVNFAALPAPLRAALQQASTSASDNDWELDPNEIIFHEKIASGAFGDLFRGSYCGQDVAIKILRNVHEDSQQFQEFLQEVAIMRKVCCRLGKGADVARVAAGSRQYEGSSSSGGSAAEAREWSHVGETGGASCRMRFLASFLLTPGSPLLALRVAPRCSGAAQEHCAVHWGLHPEAQPVHRV